MKLICQMMNMLLFIKEASQFYSPDYVGFEYYSHKDKSEEMLEFPNLVPLSHHNFEETPENMMEILVRTDEFGTDAGRFVMAHNE